MNKRGVLGSFHSCTGLVFANGEALIGVDLMIVEFESLFCRPIMVIDADLLVM